MSRALHVIGAVLVWTVRAVAAAAVFAVGWPVASVAALGRVLIRRGEMSGADDLDDVLRARIDGDGEAYDAGLLACGCPRDDRPTAGCTRCDWVTCYDHQFGPHLCERDPIRTWQDASLTPAVEAGVNEAFARIAARLSDLNRVDKQLSRYYLIGDEK